MTEGRPYRPSNATDGDIFMSEFCGKCSKFADHPDVDGPYCEIQLRAFAHSIGDPEYPSEWRYDDDDGAPCCTAFTDVNPPTEADKKYLAWLAQRDAGISDNGADE